MRSTMRASGVVVLTVLSFVAAAAPAKAQIVPPDDPFLKVPILTTGAAAPGSTVSTENHTDHTTFVPSTPALALDNSFPGYPVIVAFRLAGFTEQGFGFSTIGVRNANGSSGVVGQGVTGQRVDFKGAPIAGGGGSFTLNANGTYSFAAGNDFADLAKGSSTQTIVHYTVRGTNPDGLTRDFLGSLAVTVSKDANGNVSAATIGADFGSYGGSTKPTSSGLVFPDLKAFVTGLLRFTSGGGGGSGVNVTNDARLETFGATSSGISAISRGQRGADGSDASITDSSTRGDPGGIGGAVSVTAGGRITTHQKESPGVLAWSLGGDGGQGGDSGWTRNAKTGGSGAVGGLVTVTGDGTIETHGEKSSGILAISQGGNGGAGGDGSTFNSAEDGAPGGPGGNVNVQGSWAITTWNNAAHGIWAKSLGGTAGSGGSGGWTGTGAGDGGLGRQGGDVSITSGGAIETHGNDAYGLFGQSIGGFGGNGGDSSSIFVATGGSGEKAGKGGSVSITNNGTITTWGDRSHGIFAQSVGGGGGTGGNGSAAFGMGGSGQGGGDGGNVSVTNTKTITVNGADAKGIFAQSVGGGGGDGGDSSGIDAIGGAGSKTSGGGLVSVSNRGVINSVSNAIFAQSVGGGGGNGGSSHGLFSIGGPGGAGGDASFVTVSSHGDLTTLGTNASAIFAESVGGGGGNGGNSTAVGAFAAVAVGGHGASGGAGSLVRVGVDTNTGSVDAVTGHLETWGDNSNGIFAQSIGGGGGNGGYALSAAVGVGGAASFSLGGSAGSGGSASSAIVYFGNSTSSIFTNGANSNGIVAQSVGGGGGTGGMAIAAGGSTGFSAALALGGDGGGGGNGSSVAIGSQAHPIDGHVMTDGTKSYGILAQSIGGGGGNGGMSIAGTISVKGGGAFSFGGKGAGGGSASSATLWSNSEVFTLGNNSHGLFAQSVGGGGGSGGAAIAASLSGGQALDLAIGGSGAAGAIAGTVQVSNTASAIDTFNSHAYGILAQSVGGGGGDGGFSVAGGIAKSNSASLGIGGPGAAGGDAQWVDVSSSSDITTRGIDSHGIFAQSLGGGGGSGGFAVSGVVSTDKALSAAIGGNAGSGGSANTVNVVNTGDITTGNGGFGDGSYGIIAQSVGGGGGNGGFTGSFAGVFGGEQKGKAFSLSVGGDGGAAGNGNQVHVTNRGLITTTADDSVGISAQSVGGGGGDGGFGLNATLSGSQGGYNVGVTIGADGGSAGDGHNVLVENCAAIETQGDHSTGIRAQSIGGGGGNGGFTVNADAATGKEAKSVSVTIGGQGGSGGIARNVGVTTTASVTTHGDDAIGIQAQSLGGGGGNGGFALTGSLAGAGGKSLAMTIGGSGGNGNNAGTVDVNGSGNNAITTSGDRSYGIEAQSVGGGGGNGGFSGSVALGSGGQDPNSSSTSFALTTGGGGGNGQFAGEVHVGTVAQAFTGDVTTSGVEAIGILAQSIGGGGGNGGFGFAGAINLTNGNKAPNTDVAIAVGGGGGSGNNGQAVLVHHDGDIFTAGDGAYGIEAQSIGGGGGNGGGSRTLTLQLGQKPKTKAEKEQAGKNRSLALAIGGSGGGASDGGTVTVDHKGDITTLGGDASGIVAQSIGGGGGTGGDADEGIPDIFGLPLAKILLHRYDRSTKTFTGDSFDIVVGGGGGASGNGKAVSVKNDGVITTFGDNAHGVFAQSIGGGGGSGGSGNLGLTGTVGLGGGAGSTGNGGTVDVTLAGGVTTYGNGSHALFAQSVGGGGGVGGNVDRGLKNYLNVGVGLGFGGNGGNAGDGDTVTINSTANLTTWGTGSSGIFAQSIGGGGGVAGSAGDDVPLLNVMSFGGSVGGAGNGGRVSVTQAGDINTFGDAADGIFAQSAGGQGTGRTVDVKLTSGNITSTGLESNGIFAQSAGIGGKDNVAIRIENAKSIVTGGSNTGAGVRIADGNLNSIFNRGTITTVGGISGTSIVGGAGHETIDNLGTIVGSIDLGAGVNTLNNQAGGVLNSGASINLGAGNVLNNAGVISAGGRSVIQTTTIAGNLAQNGAPSWLFDLAGGGVSDKIVVTGTSQLTSTPTTIDLHPIAAMNDTTTFTLFQSGGSIQGAKFQFGSFDGQMPAGLTWGLVNTGSGLQLTRAESTGAFYFTGEAGGSWTSGFVNGKSNWSSAPGAANMIYGTPGPRVDVIVASTGNTELGADFTINSLTFANKGMGGAGVSLGGNSSTDTLTLMARDGRGIFVDGGSQDTTIGANLVLGADQSWVNDGTGVLRVNGAHITGDGRTLTISGNGNARINSSIQTGTGALIKQGAGLLVLGGVNTYTGGTTVSGGTLQGDTRSLQGNILNNAAVNFDQSSVGLYAGNMTGTGSLTKLNAGTLILAGANTYSGGTTVSGGVLQGDSRSLQGAIANQSAVVFDQGFTGTYAGAMNGSGSLTKTGLGRLVLSGTNSYSGGTLVDAGILQGDTRSLQGDFLNQSAVVFDQQTSGIFSGRMSGRGSLTKQGDGILALRGSNSYTGGTFITAGTLLGDSQSLQGGIVNNATVVFDQTANGSYGGVMSGQGSFVKRGGGVLALGGANTYTGGTTVEAGALLGNTTSLQGNIVNQGVVAFDQTDAGTFAGVMSGGGSLVKQGSGQLTLGGANSYLGGTLVSAGTLVGTTRSLQGDVLDQGSVVFDQNDNGIYAGNMAGAGSLVKQGSGAINMTGDFSQFTGTTTINAGQLSINGWLGGLLTVGPGGMIGGNGVVPSLTLQPGSILSPGNSVGTLHVNGDLTFRTGAAYRVETEAYGSSDSALVLGNLFATGGIVDVRAGGTRRYRPINRYAIAATGGSVTGTFAGVTTNLGYLDPTLQYDAHDVVLTLRRNDVDFHTMGTVGNQSRVATVFNQLVGTATGSFADTINNVYDLSNGQAQHAFASMSGVQYQHEARASLAVAQTFMAMSLRRLGSVAPPEGTRLVGDGGMASDALAVSKAGASTTGVDSANGIAARGWWVGGLGGMTRYRGANGDAGADAPVAGIVAGFDRAFTSNWTLGVTGGEAFPQVLLDGTDDRTRAHLLQIGAYTRYLKNSSRLDGTIGFGGQSSKTTRVITDGVIAPNASARYDGRAFVSQLEYGYTVALRNGFAIEPQAGFQFGRLSLDGATEDGAGVLGLIVPDRVATTRRSLAGARIGRTLDNATMPLMVEGRASWAHEFSLLHDVHMRFIGDATTNGFDLAAPNQLRDSAVVGFSIAGNRSKRLRLFANVDAEISGPMTSWSGNVGINKTW